MGLQYAFSGGSGARENPYMIRCQLPVKSGAAFSTRRNAANLRTSRYTTPSSSSRFFPQQPCFLPSYAWFLMIRRKQSEQQRQSGLRLSARADAVFGSLLCAIAAGVASLIAGGYHWRALVPLVFVFVLLLVALMFGAGAGVIGTLLAAMVFAAFLFQPLGRLQVGDTAARTNLAWMLLIGLFFSFLFAPPTSGLRRR
jgi:uncharacterized protein DUF4118